MKALIEIFTVQYTTSVVISGEKRFYNHKNIFFGLDLQYWSYFIKLNLMEKGNRKFKLM